MDIKKLIYLTFIELIFFAVIISSLVFVRYESRIYMDSIESYSPQIAQLQYDLKTNNLTESNSLELSSMLSEVDSVARKSLLLTNFIFPLFFVLVFVLFQVIYFHLASSASWKRIIIPAAIQSILILLFASLFLDILVYFFAAEGATSTIVSFFTLLVLLILVTLFNIHYFSTKAPFRKELKSFFRHNLGTFVNFILALVLLGAQVFFAVLVYAFTQFSISILAPAVLLAVSSIFINMHRIYLIGRIRKI